ncbi:MAG TPA: ACP S-malonyltransferase [Gemmatimonadaceae bacterium]|jgi:[acyl-carrier-protein] S-malonyltransferase
MDVVLLFPGQGSQKPGMAKDLVETFSAARDIFERADEALGMSLSTLAFDGPADDLTLTHNAQPALLAHGAAVWAVTRDVIGADVVAAAGHSLGEFTAYHAANALGLEDALRLVRRRGELMYESGVRRPGAMAAILGHTNRSIEEICLQASAEAGLVVPANYNSPGQIVISGEKAGVERAMAICKEEGAKRSMPLKVSGAFHSPLMETAEAGLREALDDATFENPHFSVYANVNAEAVMEASRAKQLLLDQLTKAVCWTKEIETLAARYPDALYVEMGPNSVLKNLVHKIAPNLKTVACGTAAEVEHLRQLAGAGVA